MAALTFNIPDANMPDVIKAWGRGRGWVAEVADPNNPGTNIPNPQNEQAYAKEMMKDMIRQQVKHYTSQSMADIPIS